MLIFLSESDPQDLSVMPTIRGSRLVNPDHAIVVQTHEPRKGKGIHSLAIGFSSGDG